MINDAYKRVTGAAAGGSLFYCRLQSAHLLAHPQPETPASVFSPATAGRTGFLLVLLNSSFWPISWTCRTVPDRPAASKELNFKNNDPTTGCPDVREIDAARFDPARTGLVCERLYQPIIDQERIHL